MLTLNQNDKLENLIGIYIAREIDELLKEIKEYRNDMVARNYPHQRISDIITKYESRDFLEEAEKEKEELNESYKE